MNKIIKGHYETLGLDPDKKHSPDDIKRAYRRAAMKTHPDRNPGDDIAVELFKNVNRAYEALTGDDTEIQDIGAPFQRASTQAWDGSQGITRQRSAEELLQELMMKVAQRKHTVEQVKRDLIDTEMKLDKVLTDIEQAATKGLDVSQKMREQHNALKYIQKVRPRMMQMIDAKIADIKSGKLYEDIDEDGNMSVKGTMLNFFNASKNLKEFIFEIEKVIPGAAGSLPRMIGDARAELERLEREKPLMLEEAPQHLPPATKRASDGGAFPSP